MHRTQVLLEEQQYRVLKNRAQQEGRSLGDLIRHLIDAGLQASRRTAKRSGKGIASLKGLIDDPGFAAKDHDHILYGGG